MRGWVSIYLGIAEYIMAEGDTQVSHTFLRGETRPEQPDPHLHSGVKPVEPLSEEEQQRLTPFIEWLESVDLGL